MDDSSIITTVGQVNSILIAGVALVLSGANISIAELPTLAKILGFFALLASLVSVIGMAMYLIMEAGNVRAERVQEGKIDENEPFYKFSDKSDFLVIATFALLCVVVCFELFITIFSNAV